MRLRASPAGLSEREVEVLVLLSRGLTNKQIGERLSLSSDSMANHIQRIFQRLGLSRRAELAAWIVRLDRSTPNRSDPPRGR